LSLTVSRFLYPEILHPALNKLWRSRDWAKLKGFARDLVRFYNDDKHIPNDLKRQAVYEIVKGKCDINGIKVSDSKINLAIELAVAAEKIKWE